MKSAITLFLVIVIFTITLINNSQSEEQCSWKPDGTQVCDEEETHNVWTEEHHDVDDDESGKKKIQTFMEENAKGIKRLEGELILNFLNEITEKNPPAPEIIVRKALDTFSIVDKNDDGKLSPEEIKVFIEPLEITDKETILEEYPDNLISILEYFDMLSKLEQTYEDVLTPYKKLDFLAPIEIKKVIEGSVKMFLEHDEDNSNSLNKEELLKSMDRKENLRAQTMTMEQKESIFSAVDANQDGEITYTEFQAILPPRPKDVTQNLKELFKHADLDVDGYLSEEEFEVHMKTMSIRMKTPAPKSNEVEDAFNKLDKDQDGKISEKEMTGISEELERLQEEKSAVAFKEMDLDGDGFLSRDEIETLAKTMSEKSGQVIDPDTLNKMLDKNSDGLIDLPEIQEIAKRMNPSM